MANDRRQSPDALKLRLRNDLEFYPQRCRARNVWVIKDPVSLQYFQFREPEFEILRWLDGKSSLQQIKRRFEDRFAPQRMTVARIHAFAVDAHRSGLVVSDTTGQGEQLLARHDRRRSDWWIATFSNPLAIRFRGIDPQPLIDWLYPRVRWMFSAWWVAACLVTVLLALATVIAGWQTFLTRLPELDSLLSARNLIWLAVALGLTKFLHEFGHALTCKHFGCQCHELGVMLLVLTPCLYCNVTDSWKLSNRWQRVAITAAGIYVEIVLAAVCSLLWWFSQPGLFNTICLNVMVVCSVGTLLLNGNPLLRYDGYYILSDIMETPNLWQDSRARLHQTVSRFFWGFDSTGSVSTRNRSGWLLAYAIGSASYRTVVVASVLYLVYRVLTPHGLLIVAEVLAATVVVGMIMVPAKSVWRTLASPIMRKRIRPANVVGSTILLLTVVAGLFFVPLPYRVTAPVTIEPLGARRVYVSVPGRLTRSVANGDVVRQGDRLALLENSDVQSEFESVQGQFLVQQLRVDSLESLRGRNADFAAQLPAAKEMLADLEKRLIQLRSDLGTLSLTAPVSGTVLPPPSVATDQASKTHLRSWVGTPLDPENLGCFLERRTLVCLVGQPGRFEAILSVDQSSVQAVRKGQRVRILLDIAPGKILWGTISDLSRNNVQSGPAASWELADRPDAMKTPSRDSVQATNEATYRAHVVIDDNDVPLTIGASGWAKVLVEPQPLSERIYRILAKTFKPVM